ncbi:SpoIIE family protein phosphatase [Magnetococcales bacterium HHB-1]
MDKAASSQRVQKAQPIILVVDDTPDNITVLSHMLKKEYSIRLAINGRLALKIANTTPQPDLILLDVMMPEMDGYEVCRRLKSDPKTRDIPIIFVTAKTEVSDELKGLSLGAVDYVTKPISAPILRARVSTHLALKQASQVLQEQNAMLRAERELVENIIVRMRSWEQFEEKNIRYLVTSVEETNGDILLSAQRDHGQQLVLMGDFTGHGLPAAIGGPLVSYIFYNMVKTHADGEAILSEINAILYKQLPANIYLAATLLEWSPETGMLNLWNTGCPHCVLIRQGEVLQTFPSIFPPLGVLPTLTEKPSEVVLASGDRLYAFSDGVIEAMNIHQEMFGQQRLEVLLKEISMTQEMRLHKIMAALSQFCGVTSFDDDITLLEVMG